MIVDTVDHAITTIFDSDSDLYSVGTVFYNLKDYRALVQRQLYQPN